MEIRPLSHKPPPRLLAVLAALVLIVAVVALVRALSGASPSAPAGLRVVAAGGGLPELDDAQGRDVLLRGVAVTALVRYAPGYAENPPVQDSDFAEIAALGQDFVRLPVSWSAIEPRPGLIDRAYLDQVAGVVRAAERHGLWVLVDLHLDRYNARLAPGNEADGAPDWATLVPSSCPAQPSPDDCARTAWQSFWTGQQVAGATLQEHYIHALLAISQRLRSEPRLAGLELMNNPSSGGEPSPQFETNQLWPFYRRAIAALRAGGEDRPLILDRAGSAEQRDSETPGLPTGLASDGDLVLAPHDYVGVFSQPAWPAGGTARLSGFYTDAVREATALHAALLIGEWGGQAGGAWEGMLAAKLGLQNAAGIGSSFWMWKQRPGFYNWNLVNLDGSLRNDTQRAQLLSEPYPQAVPGRLLSCAYAGGRLTLSYQSSSVGTALLWSGTQVRSGGASAVPRPLTRATLDGRAVAVSLSPRSFATGAASLAGDVVSVPVPAGRHTLVLSG